MSRLRRSAIKKPQYWYSSPCNNDSWLICGQLMVTESQDYQLTNGFGQDRRFTYNFFERFGGYYAGTLNEFRVRVNYRPTAKFSISASETWDRFRLPLPNRDFSVVLVSLQGNYSFTRFLTFTSLIQVDTSNTQAGASWRKISQQMRVSGDRHELDRPTTWSVCRHAASFIHRKSITPLNSTS